MKVSGRVVKHIPCLVYVYNGIHFAIAIDGRGLIATWSRRYRYSLNPSINRGGFYSVAIH